MGQGGGSWDREEDSAQGGVRRGRHLPTDVMAAAMAMSSIDWAKARKHAGGASCASATFCFFNDVAAGSSSESNFFNGTIALSKSRCSSWPGLLKVWYDSYASLAFCRLVSSAKDPHGVS